MNIPIRSQHLTRLARTGLLGLLLAGTVTSAAEVEVEFQVNSAAVVAIKNSLAGRYVQLQAHFQGGLIGFTHDGLIALRETQGLSNALRTELITLVSEDNKDRGAMYREIARANGRPDWEGRFRAVFAERWISRAPVGWYYRDSGGNWVRKTPPAA